MPTSSSVAITYVPADCGSVYPGKSKAPRAFRDVGIVEKLRKARVPSIPEHQALDAPANYQVSSFSPGCVRNKHANISVCQCVYRTITQNLSDYSSNGPSFQLVLGGECGMLPGIMSAFWQHAASQSPPKRVGLAYIDADRDFASPADPNSTGIFVGMNMTHLVRGPGALQSMEKFSRPSGGGPVCDSSNTVLFGTNMSFAGNKPDQFAYLFDNNYKVVSSESVARAPEERARETLRFLEDSVDVIIVHLDVDYIDPRMFPLAHLPNYTGVGFEEMMRALGVFMGSEKVGGLTIAEVNPDHDPGLEMVDRLTGKVVSMLAARSARAGVV